MLLFRLKDSERGLFWGVPRRSKFLGFGFGSVNAKYTRRVGFVSELLTSPAIAGCVLLPAGVWRRGWRRAC